MARRVKVANGQLEGRQQAAGVGAEAGVCDRGVGGAAGPGNADCAHLP